MSPDGTVAASHLWTRFREDRAQPQLRTVARRVVTGDWRRGWRWALRDVDFAAAPGDAIALVGANGSGKSTLLKVLTRVMYPYAGRVEVEGRVGALIEVAAGIHPELSGRENAYLYGTLLGLSRADVARRFDEIVAFAELDTAIDRQVKYFSSGMKMRLGFAIAAFLEPDVLLVDEVLAVGDATFQQKCLDRMRTVLREGTTLVLVSHDLTTLEATCRTGIWLRDGAIAADGPVGDVLSDYRQWIERSAEELVGSPGATRVTALDVVGPGGGTVRTAEPASLRVTVERGAHDSDVRDVDLFLGISEGTSSPIFTLRSDLVLGDDPCAVECALEHLPLPKGRFFVWAGVFQGAGRRDLVPWHPIGHFDVHGPTLAAPPQGIARLSPVLVSAAWSVSDPVAARR
jgi:ABC-type polysaccharide/polyol phosphate transport system ATPase subunit